MPRFIVPVLFSARLTRCSHAVISGAPSRTGTSDSGGQAFSSGWCLQPAPTWWLCCTLPSRLRPRPLSSPLHSPPYHSPRTAKFLHFCPPFLEVTPFSTMAYVSWLSLPGAVTFSSRLWPDQLKNRRAVASLDYGGNMRAGESSLLCGC